MKTIVFLGCNKSGTSREALHTSKEMGYFTVLITNRKGFMKHRDEFPEVDEMFYIENLLVKEKILAIILDLENNKKQIAAVISFIDPFVSLAAKIGAELGLNQLSTASYSIMEEKICFREHLKNLPISPVYSVLQSNKPIDSFVEEFKNDLPRIIKSPASNGSKDVLLAATISEFREGLKYFRKKFPKQNVLLEEYLIGPQYLIEVMVYKEKLSMIAVIEQEILSGERFIVNGYIYPAQLQKNDYKSLEAAVKSIILKLGLSNGSCHLEMRLINGSWKLIEINPRMSGGAMNRIIQEGTGINLVKETIKLFLGEKPRLEKSKSAHVYAKFITINTVGKLVKVIGESRAASYDGVVEVFVKPRKGSILTKPYSLGDRYAYVVASAKTAEQAMNIAVKASKEIRFYLEPL